MIPRRRKSDFTAKCLNTFVAHCSFEFAGFEKQKNTQPMTVSTETVRMAKS